MLLASRRPPHRRRSLLDRYDVAAFDHGRGPATLSPADADEIRAAGRRRARRVDPVESIARPPVSDDLVHRIMMFCAGEPVDADYVDARARGGELRRTTTAGGSRGTAEPGSDELDGFHVAIIGAGLGGICAAIRLEQAGIPYTVFEKNAGVGGTWFENTYPDLRVDVPNHFYSFSFAPNPDWSDYYARRAELADYIERCAEDYGVAPHVRFGTEVIAADVRRRAAALDAAGPRERRRVTSRSRRTR